MATPEQKIRKCMLRLAIGYFILGALGLVALLAGLFKSISPILTVLGIVGGIVALSMKPKSNA